MKKIYSSLFVCLFLIAIEGVAQFPGFINYTTPTTNYSAYQDNGFIWIASSGGLMKFDTVTKTTTHFNAYNSGLPCNNVFSIAKDNSGNFWFGTGGGATGYYEGIMVGRGLVKYDGTNWTVYKTSNSGICDNSVRTLFIENDTVWAGTYGGGISKYYGGIWTTFDRLNSDLPSDTVSCIVEDLDGLKWISTYSGVASFNGTTWTTYNKANSGLPGDTVRTIAIGPNNEKWFGTSRGIAKFNDTAWTTYTTSNSGLSYKNVVTILPESDGSIWYGTYGMAETYGGGVGKFNGTTWTNYNSSNSGLPRDNVAIVMADASGKKWITSERGSKAGEGQAQMNRFSGTAWETFDFINTTLMVNFYYTIEKDAANNLWFGGEKSGLTKYDGTTWTNYNIDNSTISDDDNYSVEFDSNGILWTTHDRGRLDKFDGTTFTTYYTPGGIFDDPFALAIDTANVKWLGCRGTGLFSFDGTTWTSYTTSTSGLPHNYINCIKIAPDGKKWIGTNGGVTVFDGTTWTTYTVASSDLPNNTVRGIDFDQFGNVWLATFGGLAKFNGTTWINYTTSGTGLPSSKIYSIAIDSYDTKWVGTYTGIAKLSGTTWTTLSSFVSAPYNYINDINFDAAGDAWFATQGHSLLEYSNTILTDFTTSAANYAPLLNYPNPALDETFLQFDVDKTEGNYTFIILDAIGKKVELPFVSFQENNHQVYQLNTSSLSNGVYFYSITSSNTVRSGKMIIQK